MPLQGAKRAPRAATAASKGRGGKLVQQGGSGAGAGGNPSMAPVSRAATPVFTPNPLRATAGAAALGAKRPPPAALGGEKSPRKGALGDKSPRSSPKRAPRAGGGAASATSGSRGPASPGFSLGSPLNRSRRGGTSTASGQASTRTMSVLDLVGLAEAEAEDAAAEAALLGAVLSNAAARPPGAGAEGSGGAPPPP